MEPPRARPDDYDVPRHAPPPIPPKSRLADEPPGLPAKPAPPSSARRDFFERTETSPPVTEKMSPVRKTLTEISNSASFAASDTLHTNGRSFKGKIGMIRSRSPSPSLVSNGVASTISSLSNGSVRELHGYVGFANIPNQVYRKAVKQGFDFTLMVVGASGLGKSTFINSLFLSQIYNRNDPKHHTVSQTTKMEEQKLSMKENGVTLNLTMVDTPGFGDQVDNTKCWEPIIEFVDRKYGAYFSEETKINRTERIADERVHAALYFIAPSGHGLKPLDVELMKHLSERLNVIPVIAKADSLTPEELAGFKSRIMEEIVAHQIKVYQFPEPDSPDDAKEEAALRARLPFAIIGSNSLMTDSTGRKQRCRKYPWGTVEVENLDHNDFIALRNMLIRSHLIDLLDVTRSVHYENFRCRQLMSPGAANAPPGARDPFTAMAAEKKEHEAQLRAKEKEMERVFREKVEEKEGKLRAYEAEGERELERERAELEALERRLGEQRAAVADLRRTNPALKPYTSSTSVTSNNSEADYLGVGYGHKSKRGSNSNLDTSTGSTGSHKKGGWLSKHGFKK